MVDDGCGKERNACTRRGPPPTNQASCWSGLTSFRRSENRSPLSCAVRMAGSCWSRVRPESERRRCYSGFAEDVDRSRFLWGGCERSSPRSRASLDIAESTGGELAEAVASESKPHEVAGALIRELGQRVPTVLVLEDLHWADEATLDVLRLLPRRLANVPALVLATYRDDELDRGHPLRIVLGELGTGDGIARLRLPPLSPFAVAKLAEPLHGSMRTSSTVRPPATFLRHRGAGGRRGRESRRPSGTRYSLAWRASVLRRGSCSRQSRSRRPTPSSGFSTKWRGRPPTGSRNAWPPACSCPNRGRLHSATSLPASRSRSLPPNAKVTLHRKALAALARRSDAGPDVARLAHHAEAAGDGEAVLRFAPDAALRASSVGAHREAAAQYARALRFAEGLPPEARAELLDHCARELSAIGEFTDAIAAYRRAISIIGRLVMPAGGGLAVRWPGHSGPSARWTRRRMPPSKRWPCSSRCHRGGSSRAYCARSDLWLYSRNLEDADAWGTRGLELARRLEDDETSVHALVNTAAAQFLMSADGGGEARAEASNSPREAGLEALVATAYTYLIFGTAEHRAHALSESYANAGIEYCSEHDLEGWRPAPGRDERAGGAQSGAGPPPPSPRPWSSPARYWSRHRHRARDARARAGAARRPRTVGSARRRARARRAIGRPLSTWAGRGGESGGRLARGPSRERDRDDRNCIRARSKAQAWVADR